MRNSLASNPGAVVIDGHGRADLGVVRALGEQGVPVFLFTDNRASPVAFSRYVKEVIPFPAAEADEAERVAALINASERFLEKPVFFSTGDSSAVFFSRNRQALEPYYRHHLSSPELIEGLYDKVRFAQVSAACGLDVPFTVAPKTLSELEAALDDLQFPVIVKPGEKQNWARHPEVRQLCGGNIKGVRIDTPDQLLAFYSAVSRYDNRLVVQNYIEGRDEAIHELHAYIDRSGELIGYFTGQKLRTYPIHRGIGCFQVSRYNPDVAAVGLRALRALGYTGHAAVQLKQRPDNQRFEIFEINCRYSAWNYLHSQAGVNLAYAAYRDCLGEKQQALPRQRDGLRWVDLSNDLKAFKDYRRIGEWGLFDWARSYLGPNCYAVFAWDDPLPLLAPAARHLGRVSSYPARWGRRKVLRLLSGESSNL